MGANFHSVAMAADILLLECTGCNRRSSLGKGEAPIWKGNMTPIRQAKFKCSRCGSGDVRAYIPLSKDEATMWLAGDPLPDGRGA